jgi:hypothetical protein
VERTCSAAILHLWKLNPPTISDPYVCRECGQTPTSLPNCFRDIPTLPRFANARLMQTKSRRHFTKSATADEFNMALEKAVREPGPRLIEVQM